MEDGDQETMIASFLSIALDQTAHTARQFLQATGWNLEEAIQLFYAKDEFGNASSSPYIPPLENEVSVSDWDSGMAEQEMGYEDSIENDGSEEENDMGYEDFAENDESEKENDTGYEDFAENDGSEEENDTRYEDVIENDGSVVRAPLPVKSDVLYDTPMFYSFRPSSLGVSKCPGVWKPDQVSTSAAETCAEKLVSLYQPPFALMYHGSFEMAKEAAIGQDRWLLVNVQSTSEFSSHMLNRDTWGNETVAQTINSYFIFWQACDDAEEGRKIITYYRLDSVPATLVIDPITGQKMRLWRGMIQAESLLEDVLQYTDSTPKDHISSLSHRRTMESLHISPLKIQDETNEYDDEMKLALALSVETLNDINEGVLQDSADTKDVANKAKHNYPPLPEEPKGDKRLLCRVGLRLPDGSRFQRSFLRSDPIQLLWSFCAEKCGDEKPFRLTHAIPRAVKDLDYDKVLTFDDSGVANSMISVIWE